MHLFRLAKLYGTRSPSVQCIPIDSRELEAVIRHCEQLRLYIQYMKISFEEIDNFTYYLPSLDTPEIMPIDNEIAGRLALVTGKESKTS